MSIPAGQTSYTVGICVADRGMLGGVSDPRDAANVRGSGRNLDERPDMTTIPPHPVLTKDWRRFVPESSDVITPESWQTRNALAARHYPQVMDLLEFGEDHLWDILWDVEQDEKPRREFPVGPGGVPIAWLPRRSWLEWHLFRGIAPAARRPAIPLAVRAAVMERDGLVCQICGDDVERDDVHLDHIKPWSRGGEHTVANLRVTHSLCNIKRGAPDGA